VIVPAIALTWELLSAIWKCIFGKKAEKKDAKSTKKPETNTTTTETATATATDKK